MKRVPLRRSTKPLKRTRLRPVSERRREVNAERARLQEEAWGPRPWKCAFERYVLAAMCVGSVTVNDARSLPQCHGPVAGHEKLSRSRAGRTDANLLNVADQEPLCSLHNEWVESNPVLAHVMGLARHSWEAS